MIQGGTSGSERGGARARVAGASPQSQSSYGITIVANGASGGGFKDFGVFRDEASYTVYLDMTDAGAYGASWTLQYALDSANRGRVFPRLAGASVCDLRNYFRTFPLKQHAETAGATIVVFGVITPQGKFEDLRIMQSPDPSSISYCWTHSENGCSAQPKSMERRCA